MPLLLGMATQPGYSEPIARIESADAVDPAAKAHFDEMRARGEKVLNLHRIAFRSPKVTRAWGSLVRDLRTEGAVPRLYREIAIMRTAVLTRSEYEWAQHRPYLLQEGFAADKLESLRSKRIDRTLPAREQALIAFVDDAVSRYGRTRKRCFATLQKHFSDQEVVEIVMIVSAYMMTATFANSFQIAVD